LRCEGSEFLRKAKAFARRNKFAYRWVPERGSGRHGALYVGARFTGLLSGMDSQLGIRKEDL
jgi:hypothetical protein